MEQQAHTEGKKRGGCLKTGLIAMGALFALVIIGGALAGGGDDEPTGSVATGDTSDDSDDGDVEVEESGRVSVTLDEILATSEAQTDAQWEAYADDLADNYRADGWTGTVQDVKEQTFGSDFYVEIQLDNSASHTVSKDLEEDEALALNKGDTITVSGDIKNATRLAGFHRVELEK